MKYSEFKAEVEKLGWCISGNKYEVYVLNHGGGKLMVINKTDTHALDPSHISYVILTHEDKSALLDLSVKLAKTPLAEREEEKRYWLRFTTPTLLKDLIPNGYLNIHRESNELSLSSDKKDTEYFKTIFTESEIAEMDITGFEKVVVLDGE